MTYTTQNTAAIDATGIGFNELAYVKTGTGTMVRTALGSDVLPTQRRNVVVSPRIASGWALRVQSTVLDFEASQAQLPVVRFGGPCSRPYVRNESTGREFFVRVELLAGEELSIDMNRKRVEIDGTMAFGWTGRWFDVKPGDHIRAGAGGIGVGFYAEIDVATVGGLVTKPVFGMAASERRALGRPQLTVARAGIGTKVNAGSAGRNGVGRGVSPRVASGTAAKKRGYS